MSRESEAAQMRLYGPALPEDIYDGRPKIVDDGLLAKLFEEHKRPRHDLFTPELAREVRAAAWAGNGGLVVDVAREAAAYCVGCGGVITRRSIQAKYCGEACRSKANDAAYYQRHQADRVRYARARRDRLRQEAKPRRCEQCGGTFRSSEKRARLCSRTCRSTYANAVRHSRPGRAPQRDARGRFTTRANY